jgi:hypothetical protein
VTAQGFDLAIRSKEGVSYVFTSVSKEEVLEWTQGIKDAVALAAASTSKDKAVRNNTRAEVRAKRGWAVKKGKRRYLLLRPGELLYFDREPTEGLSDKPKGVIQLAIASVNEITAESFLVRSEGMTYGWVFECGAADTSEWVDSISSYIVLAREALESGLSMSGWMIKKGARRWFALRRGTLYWFKTVQAVDRVSNEFANGSLSLMRCTVAPMEGQKNTLAITPPADSGNTRVYDLGCYTVEEYQQWIKALRAGVADAAHQGFVMSQAPVELGLVLGRDLEQTLEREGTELPVIVTECIEFLRLKALDSPGLFRLRSAAPVLPPR